MFLLLPLSLGAANLTRFVDPFVGTNLRDQIFATAAYPHGMVQVVPYTRHDPSTNYCCYYYDDREMFGFDLGHQTKESNAASGLVMMPVVDTVVRSKFSHGRENAAAGIYNVWLEHPNVRATATVGKRIAMYRFSFLSGGVRAVALNLNLCDSLISCSIQRVGKHAIQGYRTFRSRNYDYTIYYYTDFSEKIDTIYRDHDYAACIFFEEGVEPILVKTSISGVSIANAKLNMLSEMDEDDWNIADLAYRTDKAWNDFFSRIRVISYKYRKTLLYTAMYKTGHLPALISDINGEFRDSKGEVHNYGREYYSSLGCEAIVSCTLPFGKIIAPDYFVKMSSCGLLDNPDGVRLDKEVMEKLPAWMVLRYLGLTPGHSNECLRLVLPTMRRIKVDLGDEKTLTIIIKHHKRTYLEKIEFNGQALDDCIRLNELLKGGKLVYTKSNRFLGRYKKD